MTDPKPTERGKEPNFWDFAEPAPGSAWAEKRRLASALRELIALCVTTDAPEGELREAADATVRLCEALGEHPRRTFKQAFTAARGTGDFGPFADRSTLVGQCNPLAPPIVVTVDGDRVHAKVTFGPAYEGAPGCVHGGLVAAAFDQTFGHLMTAIGHGSLTAELTIRYLRPTPAETELSITAWVDRRDGKKSHVSATMTAGGKTVAEAHGLFVAIDPSRIRTLVEEK